MSLEKLRRVCLSAAVALAVATVAHGQSREIFPLTDLLDVIVLKHQILAISASGSGQIAGKLELGEHVLWTDARGAVAVALTDRRVLAVRAGSGSWQEARYQVNEIAAREALLGDRVALVITSRRIIGFDGGSGNLVERSIGPRESILAAQTGENTAVVVTSREALGLSPQRGGFFPIKIRLEERLVDLQTRSNVATVRTSHRILIFRSPSGTWEQRRLGLDDRR